MRINNKKYNANIYKSDSKKFAQKFYGKAHECFTKLMVELSELSNSKEDKIMEQKLRSQLGRLLANPGEHGCFFPVRKMPIYQDIISGEFMRKCQAEKLLAQEKLQLTKKAEQVMNQDMQIQEGHKKSSTSIGNARYHLVTTLIGGCCMGGALMLLPESLPLVSAFIY
jgi:hypothetical protein